MSKHYTDQKISEWIIEQNNQFILFNKPSGMPAQKDLTPENDLHSLASAYAKTSLFLVNRVDRPASGLVLMAKSPETTTKLVKQLHSPGGYKEYLVIVEKAEVDSPKEIISYIKKGRNNKAVVSQEEKEGFKKSVLHLEKLMDFENYLLLSVGIETGRFHQIRAQLSDIGIPIKGDVKYGARRKNKDRSIGLHAWKMKIKHPISGEEKTYVAPLPQNDVLWNVAQEFIQKKNQKTM